MWSVCTSKSHRILCVFFSKRDSDLYIYQLFVWSNFNFLHNSQWINLPTQSCLVHHHITYIYYFVASCLFLLKPSWSLWRCFVLLSEEIQFVSKGFPFLAKSKCSRVRCHYWSFEISIQLFRFQFLFSNYCCCVYLCVICAVSSRYYPTYFAVFM